MHRNGSHADLATPGRGSSQGALADALHRIDKLPVVAGARQLVALTTHTGPDQPHAIPGFSKGTLDRGAGVNKEKRDQLNERSLVDTGKHAGRSRVQFKGVSKSRLLIHYIRKDFFISVIEIPLGWLVLIFCFLYLVLFFFWSLVWYIAWRLGPSCFSSTVTDFTTLFIFATFTQQTIGYGNYFVTRCQSVAWLLILQTVTDILLDAIMLGVLYSRISHPKQRARSIFISDSACIARRDSILKFMFRVGDVQKTQVVDPKVKAYLYTFGHGRRTAEGESIPVRVEPLEMPPIAGRLLLPLAVEHTIDEKSPLFGHTHDSLVALQAEIVVTFEGSTEFGNPFMARQSYLPDEVYWGYTFVNIVMKPDAGDTRYRIDLRRFHHIEVQPSLPRLPPGPMSKLVVSRAAPTVPFPLLKDNTLVLSTCGVVHRVNDHLCLSFRVGDSYGYQVVEAHARLYLYRWNEGQGCHPVLDYACEMLDVGYHHGEERLLLRLPTLVTHTIDEGSPLANWLKPGGVLEDADSEICLMVEGYMYYDGDNLMRQRTYSVFNQIRVGHEFAPIIHRGRSGVTVPSNAGRMTVDWSRFSDTVEVEGNALLGLDDAAFVGVETARPLSSGDEGSGERDMYDEELTVRSRRELEHVAESSKPSSSSRPPRLASMGKRTSLQSFVKRNAFLERYASNIGGANVSLSTTAGEESTDENLTTTNQDTYMTT